MSSVGSASGPNNLQNFPLVKKIYWNGYSAPPANSTDIAASVSGQLDSVPGNYKVDVYFSPRCDNGDVHVLDVGSDRTVNRFYSQVEQLQRMLVASFERDADWRPAEKEADA